MGLLTKFVSGAADAAQQGVINWMEFDNRMQLMSKHIEMQSTAKLAEEDALYKRGQERQKEQAGENEAAAQAIAQNRGGLLSQGANAAYDAMATTDPEGARLGKEAVAQAQQSGAYTQSVTNSDRMQAGIQSGRIGVEHGLAQERADRQETRLDRADTRQEKQDALAVDHWDKSYELQKRQLQQSAANGDLTRQQLKLQIDELEKQNDPAARALLSEGAQLLAKGDKEGAVKSFSVAASHYGNKTALENLLKLGMPKDMTKADAANVSNALLKAAELEIDPRKSEELRTSAKELLGFRAGQIQKAGQPGAAIRDASMKNGLPLTPGKYTEGQSLYRDGKEYVVRGNRAFQK